MNQAIFSKSKPLQPNQSQFKNDVLGCVYRFVLEHAYQRCGGPLKQLDPNQILRGWQHMATAPRASEFCIITNISQSKHGTPLHNYKPCKDSDMGSLSIQHLLLHNIQVDFFCTPKDASDNRAYERAFIIAALANSTECAAIFEGYNNLISCLYSDDIINFSELDESHQMRHRYSVTLHLSEVKAHDMPQRFIDALKVRTYNINN